MRFEDWLSKHGLSHLNPCIAGTFNLSLLLSCCYECRDDKLPLHAIWYLEKYVKVHKAHFATVVPSLLAHIGYLQCTGSERIAGNILLENFKTDAHYDLSSEETERLIEVSFDWLVDPRKAVAVVANSIEILYYLRDEQKWISDELLAHIEVLGNRSSPALIARGRRIKQKLKKYTADQNK